MKKGIFGKIMEIDDVNKLNDIICEKAGDIIEEYIKEDRKRTARTWRYAPLEVVI